MRKFAVDFPVSCFLDGPAVRRRGRRLKLQGPSPLAYFRILLSISLENSALFRLAAGMHLGQLQVGAFLKTLKGSVDVQEAYKNQPALKACLRSKDSEAILLRSSCAAWMQIPNNSSGNTGQRQTMLVPCKGLGFASSFS